MCVWMCIYMWVCMCLCMCLYICIIHHSLWIGKFISLKYFKYFYFLFVSFSCIILIFLSTRYKKIYIFVSKMFCPFEGIIQFAHFKIKLFNKTGCLGMISIFSLKWLVPGHLTLITIIFLNLFTYLFTKNQKYSLLT